MEKSLSVLVVEDEPLILEAVRDALEEAGFSVLAAPDNGTALRHIGDDAIELGGLVTDIRLHRHTTGWEVARAARRSRGDLPVVYMTGDSAGEWSVEGVPKSVLVQKPFAVAQIVTALTALLNDSDSAAAFQG